MLSLIRDNMAGILVVSFVVFFLHTLSHDCNKIAIIKY